ncbi:MAG: DNA polymerase III subunit delta [Eubacteriales bacterium]
MEYFLELLNSLKRGMISPVYLFYGPEDYLKEQAVLRFKGALFHTGEADFNFDLVRGEAASPGDIAARAKTPPFFGERRLVVVKDPAFFKPGRAAAAGGDDGPEQEEEKQEKPAAAEAPLLEYLKAPPATTCLIFIAGETVDRRRKLFKAVEKAGRAIEFTRLEKKDLLKWLGQRAKGSGKRFAAGAAETLLDRAGTSLHALANELEKLVAYSGEAEVITAADVRELRLPPVEESIFNVVDAIGNRRPAVALNGVRDLLAAREPPMRLFSMVSRQFRLLLQVRDLLDRGCPPGQVAGRLNLHSFVARKMVEQSGNFTRTGLVKVMGELLKLDEAVKTGRLEFYPALEALVLKLCV